MKSRRRLYDVLEMRETDSLFSRLLNMFLMSLIVTNVVAIILESVQEYHLHYAAWFWYFEIFSVAVFSIEYLTRLWVCVESNSYNNDWRSRLRYMFTPLALVDLLAILPFYLGMIGQFDTRFLRILRLFRVFKLSRHFSVLAVLATVLRNESRSLLSAIFVMLVLVILAAAGIYFVEREAQPEAFGSIPRAMWWATVTLTTVGYGDVVPVTISGRLLGVLITVLGVGMAALPAGIIASGFTSELARRRESYELTAKKIMLDGEIDADDRRKLSQARNDLGIGRDDAQQMLRKVALENAVPLISNMTHCPHCGKPLA
jgi:voltage-gated potassium channel